MDTRTKDFRVVFATMDKSALINADELGQLLGKTRAAIYQILCMESGQLPAPVFRQNRYVRWRAGDVRDWLESLAVAPVREIAGKERRGRPRQPVPVSF